MKKIILSLLLLPLLSLAQQQTITYTVNPSAFEETDTITLTFDGDSIDEATWNITNNALYLWSWSFDSNDSNIIDCPTNGDWTNSSETNRLTYNATTNKYSISFVPSTFYSRNGIGSIGFLVKAKDGTGDKKSQNILLEVGLFQATLNAPLANSTSILNSGDDLTITATNTNGNANYNLLANGASIDTQTNTTSYSFTQTAISENQNYELQITQAGTTISYTFNAIVNPGTVTAAIPNGLKNGINYDTDVTRATLVLDAPNKDFVYVAGSFNNYNPNTSYAMKKDGTSGLFWLELTGLTSGQVETFQYWVVDETPIANSPTLVKTADPYSTLVLSPFDDPSIPETSYPNLPVYPAEQEREVSVIETGQTPFNWTVTNFQKPKKEDLVVYEVLVRDFDSDRNYQNLIDRIDYFKGLNINAIELMPVMEFEGNESWGYNVSYHMALDKFYGTKNKLKEFIDLCHQNGIAVILDVALNHAFGRNPMVRMWMDDPDNDGWGEPSSENPYFNETPRHSFNVGSDFNHQSTRTQAYVERVVEHWIEDFKIDGFRWDLTKGFTQNCSEADDACTNAFQQDRVDILKQYADYSWSIDDDHYIIFEHLGLDGEEQQWANHRIDEGKGIMLWGQVTSAYTEIAKGFSTNGDISRISHTSRGFTGKRLIGFAESHDVERVLYKVSTEGNTNVNDATTLENRTKRMATIGAALLTVPGPKMIWHFGELGMEDSIYTCNDGSINNPDCKLDTKPQPQWANNWPAEANRSKVYDDWARLIQLKTNEAVFEGDHAISPYINNVRQRIYVWDDTLPASDLKNVVVLCNFSVADLDIVPDFPYTGTWYDLMDNSGSTSISVSNTASPINIPAGEFRIFGNQASETLSVDNFNIENTISLSPNPAQTRFKLNKPVSSVTIMDLSGKTIQHLTGEFEKNHAFNIETLSTGMYLILIKNNSGNRAVKKLIKL